MANLTIPERYRPGLKNILTLSDQQVEQLISALSAAPFSVDAEKVSSSLIGKVTGIDAGALSEVVATLFTLYAVHAQSEVSVKRFAADVVRASAEFSPSKDADATVAQEALEKLLKIGSLNQLSKAADLQTEHQRTFCDARVLTDIRPVFPSDPANRPSGAVITHMLKLEFHEAGRHQEFFIALDTADLKSLSEVLRRAIVKANTLRDLLVEKEVPDLSIR